MLLGVLHFPKSIYFEDKNKIWEANRVYYRGFENTVKPRYFEFPREMEKMFEIAGFQNNRGSVKFVTMNHFLIKYSTV